MNNPLGSDTQPRVLITAFQGWSDAGDATSEALRHLINLQGSELLHVISGEGYVDLQLQRPRVQRNELGKREIEWPDTKLYGTVHRPSEDNDNDMGDQEAITLIDGSPVLDLFFMQGVEPNRDWENFADEVVELVEIWSVDLVVILGSMFSDAPHSRPIQTTISSESAELRTRFGAVQSEYEGPTGIIASIDIALEAADIESLSLWVQVPHYVHSAPSPKATLAILDKLEEILDIVIPRGDLFSQATDWENNINRIAANDEDMSRYIRSLEEARDDALAAETTGDALALEFEKFLERDSRKNIRDARDGTETGDEAVDGENPSTGKDAVTWENTDGSDGLPSTGNDSGENDEKGEGSSPTL